jgi:hypothetical protein
MSLLKEHVGLWNTTESPEEHPHRYTYLVIEKKEERIFN